MSTSRAGSVTVTLATVTRPARTISSAPRRDATPAWARNLARRTIRWSHGGAESVSAGHDLLRAGAARDARGAHADRDAVGRRARVARLRRALLPGVHG